MFFVALFPQFLDPAGPVLPYALLMALVVVAVDVVWFSTLAIAVDRAGSLLRPRVDGLDGAGGRRRDGRAGRAAGRRVRLSLEPG